MLSISHPPIEMTSYFKSAEGQDKIMRLYEEKLESLSIEYQYIVLETKFGKTNIVVSGSPQNPPLLLIHGSNACAPIALETYPHLTEKYQVFAVDVLAQPNKSSGKRLSMKDNSYGQWLHAIVDLLDLHQLTLAGFSFGGLVILKTLLFRQENIKEVFLAAPAFIVNGNPFKALFKVFIPMKRFMRSQNPRFIEKFLQALFSDRDEFALRFLPLVFLHFEMDFSPLPTITKAEAKSIQTPITLIAAKDDLFFPGKKMIRRAEKIFPSLKKVILLEHSKHVQNRADNKRIESLILESSDENF